jgi:hypothetical protein
LEVEVKVTEPSWGGVLDVPKSMEASIQAWVNYAQNMMAAYNLPVDRDEVTVVEYSDGQWGQLRGDNKAVQYALGKIQETEQKALEQGMWNIPEGATFWVPLQSAYYNPPVSGGGYSIPEAPPSEEVGGEGDLENSLTDIIMRAGNLGQDKKVTTIEGYIDARKTNEDEKSKIYTRMDTIISILTSLHEAASYGGAKKFEAGDKGKDSLYRDIMSTIFPGTPDENFGGGGAVKDTWNFLKEKIFGDDTGYAGGRKTAASLVEPGSQVSLAASIQGLTEFLRLSMGGFGAGAKNVVENMPSLPKISLALNTTTTITLDGRTVATAIKPYLLSDITRAISSMGRNSSLLT